MSHGIVQLRIPTILKWSKILISLYNYNLIRKCTFSIFFVLLLEFMIRNMYLGHYFTLYLKERRSLQLGWGGMTLVPYLLKIKRKSCGHVHCIRKHSLLSQKYYSLCYFLFFFLQMIALFTPVVETLSNLKMVNIRILASGCIRLETPNCLCVHRPSLFKTVSITA